MNRKHNDPAPLINLGALVCDQLKHIYFKDQSWIICHKQVAAKFTELKIKMRAFYPNKTDIEILQELGKYGRSDIEDIFG